MVAILLRCSLVVVFVRSKVVARVLLGGCHTAILFLGGGGC